MQPKAVLVQRLCVSALGALLIASAAARADDSLLLRPEPGAGFTARALLTIGERVNGYAPPGKPDGTGVWRVDENTVRLLVTHELRARQGTFYELANGTRLQGARISYLDIDRETRRVHRAGLAFGEVRDRRGQLVRAPNQISQRRDADDPAGFTSLCSAAGFAAAAGVFMDDLFFVHEETSAMAAHPHGGSVWVLDVLEQRLWALPELGRGSWENVALVETPDGRQPDGHVALLLSDDYEFGAAPLYLWIGRKRPGGDLLDRNGLRTGQLHVWVAENGDDSPQRFNGTGSRRRGAFIPIPTRLPSRAGQDGYDQDGYLDDTTLRIQARATGAFMFSRPEDLHPNPANGRHVVWAATGHGGLFPADDWGDLYLIRMTFTPTAQGFAAEAELEILHDGDEHPDLGIRNPDNLVWAGDGLVYVQEDKATKRASFGKLSGREASIWRIDPYAPRDYRRVAEINRAARLPAGAVDGRAAQFGGWESSGILDVSEAFGAAPAELLLLVNVQAHGLVGGPIGGRNDLVEGGQILLLSRPR